MEMGRPHLLDLWSRFSAGVALEPDDERTLAEAVSNDAALRADLLADERLEGALAGLARGNDDAAVFSRQFTARVAAERDGQRFVSQVARRVRAEAPRPVRRWRPAWLVLPAGLALTAVALVPVLARRHGPTSTAADDGVGAAESAALPARALPESAHAPVARVDGVSGGVFVLDQGRRTPALPGAWLARGAGLMTAGADARATLTFSDRTSLALAGNTVLAQISDGGASGEAGKAAFLARGRISAHVSPQPAGRPLVIDTPHAAATVVGTWFDLWIEGDGRATRLDVREGRVRLARVADTSSILVGAGQYALAADGSEPTVAPRPRGTVLLIVGELPLTPANEKVRRRVEGLGFEVHPHIVEPLSDEELRLATMVLITSTVESQDVNTYFRDLPIPIINWESAIFDYLGMTGPLWNGDAYASMSSGEALIRNPSHPLAAGLSGNVSLVASRPPWSEHNPKRKLMMSWGVPGPHAEVIATLPGEPSHAVVFAYDRGVPMPGLPAAPARRVGMFLWDDTPLTLTDAGWSVFDAAVSWCAQGVER
jgi:hypothetical protein